MILGVFSLPNPSELNIVSGRVITANLTYGGFRTQVFKRYYASYGINPANSIPIQRIKLTWANLSMSEMATLRLAVSTANTNYVRLECPGLGISYGGDSDTAMVTVDPETDNMTSDSMQGFTDSGEGPLVYDAQATFIVQTWYESP